MLHDVFINFQWCLKQKCWQRSHTLLIQVTQKPTHSNKYTTKIFGRPKGRWSYWPAFHTLMDCKRRFECNFGLFGVMCSIIPKNMFKWLQYIWNFLSFDKQCETNCQSTKSHLWFHFWVLLLWNPCKCNDKSIKQQKSNHVWKWFWRRKSITNTNPDE